MDRDNLYAVLDDYLASRQGHRWTAGRAVQPVKRLLGLHLFQHTQQRTVLRIRIREARRKFAPCPT